MLGTRISVRGSTGGGGGTTQHDLLTNLDYASAGHTGFVSTATVQTISGEKTFSSTVNTGAGLLPTISGTQDIGSLSFPYRDVYLDGGVRLGNTSTAVAGEIRWTGGDFEGHTGSSWVSLTTGSGGTTDHSVLNNLDFASSGHTGFMGTAGGTFTGDVTFSGADLNYGDNVISGTGDVVVGEFGMKVYVQGTEPTLGSNNKLAMWEDTSTSLTYLVYKNSSGNQKLVELA